MNHSFLSGGVRRLARHSKELLLIIAVVLVGSRVSFSHSVEAQEEVVTQRAYALEIEAIQNAFLEPGELVPSERKVLYEQVMSVTAYNSVPWQTDSTPCIGAAGDICQLADAGIQVCAANFVPLGTRIYVEGVGECTVADRMNARYFYRVDVFMENDVSAARSFGVQRRLVTVLQ